MKIMLNRIVLFIVFSVFVSIASAKVMVVNKCGSDVQPGPGVNFSEAVASADLIRFSCGTGLTTILITRPHRVTRPITIDGDKRIALSGNGDTGFLELFSVAVNGDLRDRRNDTVVLRNLQISKVGTPQHPAISGLMHVSLTDVDVDQTERFVSIGYRRVSIQKSRFRDNTGDVVEAGSFNIRDSRFHDTKGHLLKSFIAPPGATLGATKGVIVIQNVDVRNARIGLGGNSYFTHCDLTISGSTFTKLQGAVWNRLVAISASGVRLVVPSHDPGAIYSDCESTVIRHTAFDQNRGRGGALNLGPSSRSLTARRATFIENASDAQGGAIRIVQPQLRPHVSLQFSVFTNNQARNGGGAVAMAPRLDPWRANRQRTSPFGELAIQACVFNGNSASLGGAISALETHVSLDSTFVLGNTGTIGTSGIHAAGNQSRLTISNTLVARNVGGRSPAVSAARGDFTNVTVARNRGIGVASTGEVGLANTVIAENSAGNCVAAAGASYLDRSSNMQFPGDSCGATVQILDPALDELFLPSLWSPLLEAGDDGACKRPPVRGKDIFGQFRPRHERCTIGAAEGEISRLFASNFGLAALVGKMGCSSGKYRVFGCATESRREGARVELQPAHAVH